MDATKKLEILHYLETTVFPTLSPVARIPNNPPLSISEISEKARQTLEHDPPLFLEKYGSHLRMDDLAAFEIMKGDYEVDYYVERLSMILSKNNNNNNNNNNNVLKQDISKKGVTTPIRDFTPSHKQIQNRRLRYLESRLEGTDYFSDEEIRTRDPRLYDFYIGRHVPESERSRPFSEDVTLVERILHGVDHQRAMEILEQLEVRDREVEEEEEEEEDEEEEEEEEEEGEEEETDGADKGGNEERQSKDVAEGITIEERDALREELLRLMKERFLNGKDTDFDYSQCDFNSEYDDILQMQRDAEDAYFESMDVDEPSDEGGGSLSVLGPSEYDY